MVGSVTLRRLRLRDGQRPASELAAVFDEIATELGAPGDFDAEALAAAERAAREVVAPVRDETSVEFVTLDPVGSTDLDQAFHIEEAGGGYRVRYAIADVPAFVAPGGVLDQATRLRAQTYYLPNGRRPLHPPVLSEGAASLLPGETRPAFVWDFRLDGQGMPVEVSVDRALVRSRAQLDYSSVQAQLDQDTAPPMLQLLVRVGQLRIEQEGRRGGASLPKPEQEIHPEDGHYRLRFRPLAPVEEYNAHLSLMTGMAAADLMVGTGVGILRTMPTPDPSAVAAFARQAGALGVPWPGGQQYGEFLRGLDRNNPRHLALIYQATSLFRGAGYTLLEGAGRTPSNNGGSSDAATGHQTGGASDPADCEVAASGAGLMHAAVAHRYAHVTAPLRRLVDRFGLAICAAISTGAEIPQWAEEGLNGLPEIMKISDRRAAAIDRACLDAVEAAVLAPLVGQVVRATVVENRGSKGLLIQVAEPAVLARCDGDAEAGQAIEAEVVEANLSAHSVRFTVVGS